MHEQLGNTDQRLPHALLVRYLVCPCLERSAQQWSRLATSRDEAKI